MPTSSIQSVTVFRIPAVISTSTSRPLTQELDSCEHLNDICRTVLRQLIYSIKDS